MPVSYEAWGESLVVLIYVSCATLAAAHALLTKPDPRSAFGWIAVCWLFPLAGSVLYGLFGINRVRARAKQLRSSAKTLTTTPMSWTHAEVTTQLTRIGDAVTQWPRVSGNGVEALDNGENAFPRMLAAIAAAEHTIWLATYIFETDTVGRQFIDALAAATDRGVQVRVLVDGIGEWYSWPPAVSRLRRAGVRAARFLPPRLLPPRLSLNLRNHRKLLLIDAHTCFVGGMNLGGREVGKPNHRRMADLHFQVRGPVVAQFSQAFAIDWLFACGESLSMSPPPSPAGECVCRVITDGPDEDIDKLLVVIVAAISVARHQVLIMTPYFIPPPELSTALEAAALRGVEVCLVLPQRSNLPFVDWASRRWLPPLLERGVRIYRQRPPFSHSKLLIVDGEYAQIGSANLDPRSLRLNFEIALEIYDATVCGQLETYIASARQKSLPYTMDRANRSHWLSRTRNSLCWLLSAYL